jgi:metacaspase-1
MRRRALLVGIDTYELGTVPRLRGSVNDVARIRDMLRNRFGFTNGDIRVVVEERATKAAIEHRLAWLVDGAAAGDILVFHFSGHGTRIRDRDEQDELSDHMDEAICAYDMSWDCGYITDDHIAGIFESVAPGVLVEVILDTCFAGMGRSELRVGLPPQERPQEAPLRFLAPPLDVAARHDGEPDLPTTSLLDSVREKAEVALWAATPEDGTSNEAYFNGRFDGVFTYYLTRVVADAGAELSRDAIIDAVARAIEDDGYAQRPELDCAAPLRAGEPLGGELVRETWTPFDL